MKNLFSIILALVILLASLGLGSCSQEAGAPDDSIGPDTGGQGGDEQPREAGKTFYVSADGSDENDGSKEAPLATFQGAVTAVRGFRAENGIPEGGIDVIFAPGTYYISSQTVFTDEDSGEDGKEIIYRAEKDGEVIFSGGVTIDPSLFVTASDEVKSKVPEGTVRDNLLEVDLAAAGCYDLDDSREYTEEWACYSYRQELYADNVRQTVARWPNSGYDVTPAFSQYGERAHLAVPEDKAPLWAEEPARFYGYPVVDWDSVNLQEYDIEISKESSQLFLSSNKGRQIIGTSSVRYYLYNLLCELDTPGEYFWDVGAGKLYYYPDGDINDMKISFSQFADNWFILDGVSDISFEGIIFENGRSDIFAGGNTDTRGISIEKCVFRCLGGYAVNAKGTQFTIMNCEMYNLGSGCVKLTGGDSNDVNSSGTVITNNLIHDWSQTYTVYNPGIYVLGYGFTISHNELYNSPHEAIAFSTGGSVIEYNYIHEVCSQTTDAGAVYTGRRWDWSANTIRFNLIENIKDQVFGGTPNGIYLDDCLSGQTVYGNILKNVSGRCLVSGGGKKNIFFNNIIINPEHTPFFCDERGTGTEFGHDFVVYPDGYMWSGITKNVNYLSDMQRFAVPENLLLIEHTGYSTMDEPDDPGTPAYVIVRDNIIVGSIREFGGSQYWGTNESNICYREDPGFADEKNGNYTLKEDSRVFRDIPGFINIDSELIGLIK
ncbi:MAG: right-handed parallel beta-helix repeat-containing protein [Clostridia bacterium]|nr:right-handed parallel beta-helix repeat-containing protein [Clostridia bacterium]